MSAPAVSTHVAEQAVIVDGRCILEELYTYKEVAARLKFSVSTIKRLVSEGRISAIRDGYKTVRFRASAVNAYLDALPSASRAHF